MSPNCYITKYPVPYCKVAIYGDLPTSEKKEDYYVYPHSLHYFYWS